MLIFLKIYIFSNWSKLLVWNLWHEPKTSASISDSLIEIQGTLCGLQNGGGAERPQAVDCVTAHTALCLLQSRLVYNPSVSLIVLRAV